MKAFAAEIKTRGRLTIPKALRDPGLLEEGEVVSIIPVGNSVLVTPKPLALDKARKEIRRVLKASCLSDEDVLAAIGEERGRLYGDLYGRKTR
jgi:bifunctional DNA-binding transcriptional regulator/antitoxin component of YhaV-PrlF toxin-antitoxin module